MLVFILIQVVQVIIPILPGGVSCLGGVIFFGPWLGFLYNYIGICIGSIAVFGISKTIGRPVLYKMFSEKMIEKYDGWTQKDGKFLKLFALAIFFPVAPDDFLCYLAGTTKMTWKQFTAVIVLGKPFSIALYSLGLTTAFKMLFSL
ncbi:MAG: TVP38/TMEM64 family protein [Coprococcus sp.]